MFEYLQYKLIWFNDLLNNEISVYEKHTFEWNSPFEYPFELTQWMLWHNFKSSICDYVTSPYELL